MTIRFESITSALRDDGVLRSVGDITADEADQHQFFCTDCKNIHGKNVALTLVNGHNHKYESRKLDPRIGVPVMAGKGEPVAKTKVLWQPSHFKRMPGAEQHVCSNDVAYSAFRSTALYFDAKIIDKKNQSHMFPILSPRHGAYEQEEPAATQMAPRFRPKGMKSIGVRDAQDFIKLLEHFEAHAGLQHHQFFRDAAHQKRSFTETHFEDGSALFDYLDRNAAVGKAQAIVCSYVFNPNTSVQAREKVIGGDGFIDRDVSKQLDDRKLNIFARGANRQSIQALSDLSYRNGVFNKAPVLIFGSCWIEDTYLDEKAHHVEIEIYDPRQVSAWDRTSGFVPPYNPKNGDNDLVLAL